MTGQWEAFLKKIQHGQSPLEPFLDGISQYVRSVVGKVGQTKPVPRTTVSDSPKSPESPDPASAKTFSNFTTLTELLEKATVSLTPAGRAANETTPVLFVMKEAPRPVSKRKPAKKAGKSNGARAAAAQTQSGTKERAASVSGSDPHRIEHALRAWRLSEAKRRRVPAFRIFGDRALQSIATTAPRNEAELLAVHGIGAGIVKKYGAHIFRLIAALR
jgi:superfamily II DNA helicase RecQ